MTTGGENEEKTIQQTGLDASGALSDCPYLLMPGSGRT